MTRHDQSHIADGPPLYPSLSHPTAPACLSKEFGTTRRFHKIEVMTNGNETFPTCGVSLSYHHTIRFGHRTPSPTCPCARCMAWHSVSFSSGNVCLFGESTYVLLVYRFRNRRSASSSSSSSSSSSRLRSLLAPEWAAGSKKIMVNFKLLPPLLSY